MAEQEIVKIINIKTGEAINSVKELKQYINELKDDLVKVDKNSKEYTDTLEVIANAQTKLTQVNKDAKNAINYQEGSYRALNQELVNLRNEYKNLSEAERNNAEVGGAMLSRIQELDTELKSIDATLGNHQRNVGNYKSAIEDVTVSYQSQRQELKALRVVLEQLDPASQEYITAFNRAAEITHNLTEQQEMLKYSSKDLGDQISNIRGIATGMAAGFSAVNAAMGLFGEKNEDVAKALLKVQQCMAIVQGLQGMDGLLKRTQGLSNAMKAWFTSSTQVATALNAEAVATNTATVAQRGLNAAMKANPVGLVITAVMGLVTVLSLFSGKIKEAVKNNEKWNKVLGVLKGIAATVGAVLKAHFLVPLKEIVNYFGTLAKVMKDVFTGQWGKIEEDLKQGIKNARDIVVDSIEDIEGAYDGAVQKHLTERERMRAADRTKELEELMELNEAKYGSDWKYTEDGKALYDEYFSNLAYQYDENSDDYKKAVLAKLRYDREYNEKKKKAEEDAAKEEEERRKAAANAAEDAKKKREQLEQKYQSTIAKNYSTSIREVVNTYKDNLSTLEEFYQLQIKATDDKKIKDVIQAQIDKIREEFQKYSNSEIWNLENQAMGIFVGEPEATKQRIETEFNSIKKAFEKIKDNALKYEYDETNKKVNDNIIKLFKKTIEPQFNKEIADLEREIDNAQLDYSFLEQNMMLIEDTNSEYGVYIKTLDKFENTKEKENLLLKLNTQIFETQKLELLKTKEYYQAIVDYTNKNELLPSDEFKEAEEQLENINQQMKELYLNYQKAQSNIKKTSTEGAYENEDKEYEKAMNDIAQKYEEKRSGFIGALNGQTSWYNLKWTKQQMEEEYNATVQHLGRQKELLEKSLADEKIIGEDRKAIQEKLSGVMKTIMETDKEHQQQYWSFTLAQIDEAAKQFEHFCNQMGSMFDSLADYYMEDAKIKKEKGEIDQKTYEQQFKKAQNYQIAGAVMNMIGGVVGAFEQGLMQFGMPWGLVVGGIGATAAIATGSAQIAKIKATKMDGSTGSASSASVPAPDTSSFYQPMYTQNITSETDTENLRNAIMNGMSGVNLAVSVTEINDVQKRVKVKESESDF